MIIFNPEQEDIINEGVNHIRNGYDQVFQIAGGPGVGKTEVINEILRRSKVPMHKVAPMAFIGQAAINMRVRGMITAKTIHSWLYDYKEEIVRDKNGDPILDPVFNKPVIKRIPIPRDLSEIDLFIIDEGYTVPYYMKKDIEDKGKKIIVCGDVNQLPPVEDKPAYLVDGKIHYLTKIMRQAEGSYIIYLSNLVLNGIEPPIGLHGNVLVIEQKDLTVDMIKNSQVIICGTNKTRNYYNDYIRHEMLGKTTTLPGLYERVMCRKNNWNIDVDGINLTNGLTGTVVKPADVYNFDNKSFTIDFRSDLLGLYFPNVKCDYHYFTAKSKSEKDYIKNSKYATGNMFEYAYAKTTHLCQGSQYYNGIYISEYLNRDIQTRLDFTAVTRFRNFLIYVVKNRRKYF